MTFRELDGHYKHLDAVKLEEWDKISYLATFIVNTNVEAKDQVTALDLNPFRDAEESKKKDMFGSAEELQAYLKGESHNKD